MIDKVDQPSLQRNLQLVVEAGLLLSKGLDLKSFLQAATDAGRELCGAQVGAFLRCQRDGSWQLDSLSGAEVSRFSAVPLSGMTTLLGPVFEGSSILRCADITQDPRLGPNAPYGNPPGPLPLRSYLAAPVRSHTGEALGAMLYGHELADVFDKEAEDLVRMVAAQAAAAIEIFGLREPGEIDRWQHAAARQANEIAAIVESSDDAILSKDLTGRIMSWNQAASRILGYSREEILGRSILTLIPKELHSEEATILEKIRSGVRIDHYETVRVTKGGERIDVSLSISPVRDASGTIVGASKILRDVSHKKRMEKSLIQAEKIAALGRMAATIAHEINNPLEAIMNLIYLARTNAGDQDAVANLMSAAESELVRVSHIARQTLGFYRENASATSVSLNELAAEAMRIYEPRCSAVNIRLEAELKSTRNVVIRKGEIMQVLSNLLANSIYAMPAGGRLLISTDDEDRPEGHGVVLTVADTGTGIQPEHLPRIFEAFFTTRGSIGTGIGLFVARQFVEGHGGSITVGTSVDPEGHGTAMKIFLPLETKLAEELAVRLFQPETPSLSTA